MKFSTSKALIIATAIAIPAFSYADATPDTKVTEALSKNAMSKLQMLHELRFKLVCKVN